MRLDTDEATGRSTVVLSHRNLLTLLSKLYLDGSACTIEGDSTDCPLAVKAETDEVHYVSRPYGPGPMHPATELILTAIRDKVAADNLSI